METDVYCFSSLSRLNRSIVRHHVFKRKHWVNLYLCRAELSSLTHQSSVLDLSGSILCNSELDLEGVKVMLHAAIIWSKCRAEILTLSSSACRAVFFLGSKVTDTRKYNAHLAVSAGLEVEAGFQESTGNGISTLSEPHKGGSSDGWLVILASYCECCSEKKLCWGHPFFHVTRFWAWITWLMLSHPVSGY